jgi:mannose-1-phosphate guanylyltransferase / phosphomannomutase
LEFYTAALEHAVDIDRVRQRSFKIVLDYSYGAVSIVMPNLLTKLRAEVLAVNPFASTLAATTEFGETNVLRVAELVRASGSDLGFVVDPDGELSTVIDDTGHILEPEELLLAICSLLADALPDARVAVPVNVTSAVEAILGEDAVARTKLASASLMEASLLDVTFAGAGDGGCIWPDFLPAYDAAVTLVKLLDLLAQVDRPLSTVCASLPSVHVAHETIVTPWERKGTVMREIVEKVGNRQVELIDGVKIIDQDRWALVLPDPEDALTHVWAEAGSDQDARRLTQEYVQRIRQILR